MSKIYMQNDGSIEQREYKCFDPFLSGDCGQAFRWKEINENLMIGIVGNRLVRIEKKNDDEFYFDIDKKYFDEVLVNYFDLERDYDKILSTYDEENLVQKVKKYYGIRILRQDSWEALCSFIISQNNNIPRIKGIIERLCENFGEKIEDNYYSFPSAEKIASLEVEDLAIIRSGFRAKYILDAAKKVTSGEVDLEKIKNMSTEEGENELIKIKGVGKKVAMCTLLFGFNKVDAFPVDVWIKRIMEEKYPNGLPECTKGTEGIAQQYLFMGRE